MVVYYSVINLNPFRERRINYWFINLQLISFSVVSHLLVN